MTAFNYIALNETGSRLKGILEADSARQVRQLLRDKGLTPLQVAGARERIGKKKINALFARINARELALITRQLATLLQAGLPVEEGLAVVSRQIRSGRVSSVLLRYAPGYWKAIPWRTAWKNTPTCSRAYTGPPSPQASRPATCMKY